MAKTPSNSGKPWTPSQNAQLRREAAQNTPTRVLALHLQRTPAAVSNQASNLGVSLKPTNQSPYNRRSK